jgi:hypothetical protein
VIAARERTLGFRVRAVLPPLALLLTALDRTHQVLRGLDAGTLLRTVVTQEM